MHDPERRGGGAVDWAARDEATRLARATAAAIIRWTGIEISRDV